MKSEIRALLSRVARHLLKEGATVLRPETALCFKEVKSNGT